ncbi:fibronectin type III domain-containing protein [Bacillus subtilis]|uniref:fibronectin type III domain-containing protein n=1 Tax=Bacillus subtilis TaxID=1423 RepID=UPI0009ACE4D1|nr:fibronectin type III domain-containing protein [Bacillus subtilis]
MKHPDAPQNLTYEAGTNEISLSWDKVDGADSYDIFRSGNKIDNVTENKYQSTGLKPDTQYTFVVRAVNAAGVSEPSDSLVTRTKPDPTTEG